MLFYRNDLCYGLNATQMPGSPPAGRSWGYLICVTAIETGPHVWEDVDKLTLRDAGK